MSRMRLSATRLSRTRLSATRRGLTVVAGAAFASIAFGGPAFAHLAASPSTVTPGSTVKVTFTIQHGCDASPTVKVAIKLPTGVTAAKPAGPKGFVGAVAGNVLTYDKGTLGPKTHGAFTAVLTFPPTTAVLSFPAVQTCAKGAISWIAVPTKAVPKPAHPAPQIGVGVKASTH